MIGTVPVYDSVIHYQRDLATLTAKDFLDVIRLPYLWFPFSLCFPGKLTGQIEIVLHRPPALAQVQHGAANRTSRLPPSGSVTPTAVQSC